MEKWHRLLAMHLDWNDLGRQYFYGLAIGGFMSPVTIKKNPDGTYSVKHGHSGKTSAKHTTKKKAEKQANLLRAVSHGWKPSGGK